MTANLATFFGSVFVFAVIAGFGTVIAKGRVQWRWLFVALFIYAVEDFALTSAWGYFNKWKVIESSWNWEGKILSTLLMLLIGYLLFRKCWDETGIVLAQRGPATRPGWIVAAVFCLSYIPAAIFLAPGVAGTSFDDIAFQATMPGIEEEIFYRGLLLLALDKAFGTPLTILKAPIGWGAVMSSLLFALTHVFGMGADLSVSIDWTFAPLFALAAFILVWLRAATGSILAPLTVHSWGNLSFYLL